MFERGVVHADAGGPIIANAYRVRYALSVDSPHEGARIMRAAIPIAREHGAGFNQSLPLLSAAKIAAGRGSDRTSARLLGAFSHDGGRWSGLPGAHEEYERLIDQLSIRLRAATLEDELRLGGQLSIREALELAEDIVAATATERSQ
jgi:hypothetical protein